jgi:hypothetical protein
MPAALDATVHQLSRAVMSRAHDIAATVLYAVFTAHDLLLHIRARLTAQHASA